MKACATCGGRVSAGDQEIERRVGRHMFEGPVAGWSCAACGEAYYDGSDVERFERDVAHWLISHGAADVEGLRFVRKQAGVRAIDVSALLGVSAATVSQWETGQRDADRATRAIIAALVLEALGATVSIHELLRARERPDVTPRVRLSRAA